MKKDILVEIVKKKQRRLLEQLEHGSQIESLEKEVATLIGKRGASPFKGRFYEAMAKPGLSIIGEVKKASPSKGVIREDFHPLELAKAYESAVDAISVLTEEDFFMGKDAYLKEISAGVSLPTLCKDFIISEEQIYKAKLLGASCILLIVAILKPDTLKRYLHCAHEIGLDVLVETHTAEEIAIALEAGANIIGVNNRNLKTFEISIEVSLALRNLIPEGILMISESGIDTEEDVMKLKKAKVDGILVGESFMRSGDIGQKAEVFRSATPLD